MRSFSRASRVATCVSLASVAMAAVPNAVWLDVPFVKQQKDGCGAACISMVIEYWARNGSRSPRVSADAAVIQEALYSKEAKGILGSAMKRYFEQAGFRAFVFGGEWTDLRQHLLKGRPLIVCLRPSPSAPLHYVVLAGLDSGQGWVLVNDPAQRKLLKLDRAAFEKGWKAAQNWTLLALPRQDD